jgi:hypothetical protein
MKINIASAIVIPNTPLAARNLLVFTNNRNGKRFGKTDKLMTCTSFFDSIRNLK